MRTMRASESARTCASTPNQARQAVGPGCRGRGGQKFPCRRCKKRWTEPAPEAAVTWVLKPRIWRIGAAGRNIHKEGDASPELAWPSSKGPAGNLPAADPRRKSGHLRPISSNPECCPMVEHKSAPRATTPQRVQVDKQPRNDGKWANLHVSHRNRPLSGGQAKCQQTAWKGGAVRPDALMGKESTTPRRAATMPENNINPTGGDNGPMYTRASQGLGRHP